jgi:hypothetical protein
MTKGRHATVGLGNPTPYFRLIGRLFFQLGGCKLKLRSPFYVLVVQVMTKPVADLDVFMGNPWANMGSSMGRFQLQTPLQCYPDVG